MKKLIGLLVVAFSIGTLDDVGNMLGGILNFGQITLAMRGIAASAPDSLASTPVGLDDILATPAKVALPPVRIIRGAGSATPAPTPPTPSLASVFGS